jgi:cytochrome c oxidase subunit 2
MFFIYIFNFIYLDAPRAWQKGFQESASPIAEGLNDLHDYIMLIIIFVCAFVLWMFFCILDNFVMSKISLTEDIVVDLNPIRWRNTDRAYDLSKKFYDFARGRHLSHGVSIEVIWTSIPTFILFSIGIPSFALLYAMDEIVDPVVTLKIVGNQWYWGYEYGDEVESKSVSTSEDEDFDWDMDSYIEMPTEFLFPGEFLYLTTDNTVVLPTNSHIRLLVTSNDVLHAWSIPALGVKIDAVPGRINQVSAYIKRPGLYFGQCSELCGVDHGFMPIVVHAVSLEEYLIWITEQQNKNI